MGEDCDVSLVWQHQKREGIAVKGAYIQGIDRRSVQHDGVISVEVIFFVSVKKKCYFCSPILLLRKCLMKRVTIFITLLLAVTSSAFAQTLTLDKSTKLYGYKNNEGGWQIAPQYGTAYAFQGKFKRFAVVKLDRYWGCIDVRGQLIVRNIFVTADEAEAAGKAWEAGGEPDKWIYPAENPATGLWGFVNYYGDWKFQPEYQEASVYVGTDPMTFACVKTGDRWGCIDGRGVMIVANVFMSQSDAQLAGEQWINGLHYDTWRCPTRDKSTGSWGYVNYLGRWCVEPEYEAADRFGKDNKYVYAQVKQNGRWGSIDRNGKVVSHCVFFTIQDADYALSQIEHGRPLSGWRLPVTDLASGLWGWVDATGEWCIEPIYQDATHFTNDTGNFATGKYEGYWACLDNTGEWISKNVFVLSIDAWHAGYEWDNQQECGHWLWPVKNVESGYWGYVDYRGQWVITPHFEDARPFIETWNNRSAPARMDGKWGCIDHTGQYVVKNIYETDSEASVAGRRWSEKKKF